MKSDIVLKEIFMIDYQRIIRHIKRVMIYLALSVLTVMAVIGVSALTVHLLEKPNLQSNCPITKGQP
jgi:hypothetical protein